MEPFAFLFPASDLNPRLVSEMFADQYRALKAHYPCAILHERKIQGASLAGCRVVYRGWMLAPLDYSDMINAILKAGGQPITPLAEYLQCHRLPGWYPSIQDLTIPTRFFAADCDIEQELRVLEWPGYFIKDHVKSNRGPLGSIARKPCEAPAIVAELKRFRGHLEGGLCVRQVVKVAQERRIFVRDGQVFATPDTPADYLTLAERIAHSRIKAPFYSLDLGMTQEGEAFVIEIGDGQVSDLVGWTVEQFVDLWRNPHAKP